MKRLVETGSSLKDVEVAKEVHVAATLNGKDKSPKVPDPAPSTSNNSVPDISPDPVPSTPVKHQSSQTASEI